MLYEYMTHRINTLAFATPLYMISYRPSNLLAIYQYYILLFTSPFCNAARLDKSITPCLTS